MKPDGGALFLVKPRVGNNGEGPPPFNLILNLIVHLIPPDMRRLRFARSAAEKGGAFPLAFAVQSMARHGRRARCQAAPAGLSRAARGGYGCGFGPAYRLGRNLGKAGR